MHFSDLSIPVTQKDVLNGLISQFKDVSSKN